MTETITVEVWYGRDNDPKDPDETIDVPVGETHLFEDDPHFHAALGLRIAPEDRPATLNVYTNDSVRAPPVQDHHVDTAAWNGPVERGLTYPEDSTMPPFECEIWGRVLFHVEEGAER